MALVAQVVLAPAAAMMPACHDASLPRLPPISSSSCPSSFVFFFCGAYSISPCWLRTARRTGGPPVSAEVGQVFTKRMADAALPASFRRSNIVSVAVMNAAELASLRAELREARAPSRSLQGVSERAGIAARQEKH